MSCNSIPNHELLARFIVKGRWIRKDNTVKPEAFIPYPNVELSVTRHLNLLEADIWRYGRLAVGDPPRSLHGRADIEVGHVKHQGLHIAIDPADNNPNHANVINWPSDKNAQKMKAILLAVKAQFIANPVTTI